MGTPSPPIHVGRRRRTRIALLLGTSCVALLLAEGGLRVRQRLRYGVWGVAVAEQNLMLDPGTGLRVLRPGWASRSITINSRGFRGPEIDDPKPPGRVRIAFLGASTTYCGEVSGDRQVWPHLVRDALERLHEGHEFDYVNGGVPGYDVADSLKNLETRIAPFRPDVVVIYHATNDLASDTRALAREQGVFRGRPEDPSWLARHSVLWNLVEKNWLIRKGRGAAAGGESRLRYDPGTLAAGFRERLRALVRSAAARGCVVAIATFSIRARRSQPFEEQLDAFNTSLLYMPYMTVEGLLDGFEAYNRAIRDVAGETGAILVGGEESIPGDDAHFRDSVHFTDAGCAAMARRVVDALEASPAFRELVRSEKR